MGIYLPAIFLIFQLVECLSDKISLKTYLSQLIKVFFIYFFSLYSLSLHVGIKCIGINKLV